MRHKAQPIAHIGSIVVREFQTTDDRALQRAANFASIARMTASLPSPYRLHHAQAWIALCRRRYARSTSTKRNFAICDGDQLIGAIGASRYGDEAEIGYWLTPEYWGKGMMTKVVRRLLPVVQQWWNITRVVARTFPENIGSRRVLEKNGFQQTALQLKGHRKGKQWLDIAVYTKYGKS